MFKETTAYSITTSAAGASAAGTATLPEYYTSQKESVMLSSGSLSPNALNMYSASDGWTQNDSFDCNDVAPNSALYRPNEDDDGNEIGLNGIEDDDEEEADHGSREEALLLKEMDAQLAKELTAMTPEQRSLVFDDVHGVSPLLPESPEFLAQKLHEFNDYIIKQGQKPMQNEYYAKRSMRLLFLRATGYDVGQATILLKKFIDCKLDLFGPSSVFRDITIEQDFEPFPDDIKCLQSGVMQLLPSRDQGGRFVIFIHAPISSRFSLQSLMKSYFFVCYSAVARSVENQRRGVVKVTYNAGDNPCTSASFIKRIKRIGETRHCIPMRTVAHHMCVSDSSQKIYTQLVMLVIGYKHRVRFRAHYGGHGESISALQAYGIPRQLLPISEDGQLNLDNHVIWWDKVLQREQQEKQPSGQHFLDYEISIPPAGNVPLMSNTKKELVIDCSIAAVSDTMVLPSSNSAKDIFGTVKNQPVTTSDNNNKDKLTTANNKSTSRKKNGNKSESAAISSEDVVLIDLPRYYDVLYGRGKMATEHPGNIRLHQLVGIYYERYEKGRKLEKIDIALEIINIVHQSSGRFIKPYGKVKNQWVEVTEVEARDKVSSTFRNLRAQLKAVTQLQQAEKDGKGKQHQEIDGMESATKKAARRSNSGNSSKTTDYNCLEFNGKSMEKVSSMRGSSSLSSSTSSLDALKQASLTASDFFLAPFR